MLTKKNLNMSASSNAFNALGDPTRRAIFEKLHKRPMAVVDIADGLPVSRPAVSQHLKVLKDAKLISLKTNGNKNIYELNREGILAMRDYLDKFWDEALVNFKQLAEQTEKNNNNTKS
jgi:DNA-binding transcriptional ArsR family regulator